MNTISVFIVHYINISEIHPFLHHAGNAVLNINEMNEVFKIEMCMSTTIYKLFCQNDIQTD